ncbi:MAG: potassium transporter TrkA [Methanoregulaceae archaeon]|nr:potassium transporter TrkA [Methanoregulaceae archaeon]
MSSPLSGALWRRITSSERIKIASYFLLFAFQIILYTTVFHVAYPALEKKSISWPQSLFFVVETVTTVGYGELPPFQNDLTILITIVMMITGIILIFMIIPLFLVPILSSFFKSSPPRRPPYDLEGHVIIVGYGELTRSLVESLSISNLPLLIVLEDPELARVAARETSAHAFVMWGDYGENEVWVNAGVKHAHTIILTEDEQTSAAIILGIRGLVTGSIVAVVDKLSSNRYLRYAGAGYVLSAKHVTGQILARHATLTSHIDTIIEETISDGVPADLLKETGTRLRIINLPILGGSHATGKTLKELDLFEKYGFFTLLISRGGHFHLYPRDDDVIDTSTMLFLIGPVSRIEEMVKAVFMVPGDRKEIALIGGFGDVGLSAYNELTNLGIECIAIDKKKYGVCQVIGNAEDESVLREAHIEDARFFIVALNNDDLNIFTTLIARNLNPDIRILARANEPASVSKLYRAGADYVALLPSIGGQVIGGVVLSDIIHVILNLPDGQKVVRMLVRVSDGRTVSWLEKKAQVTIVGIEGREQSVVRPSGDHPLSLGDGLIVIGHRTGLKRLIEFA